MGMAPRETSRSKATTVSSRLASSAATRAAWSTSLSRLVAILACLSLAGCGFQLQGALTTPAEMERTYIATDDQRSLFYRELRATLDYQKALVTFERVQQTAGGV